MTTGGRATIINWDHFGVPGGSQTRFIQPDASSATLNRVIGGFPSRVDGSLLSNGRVYLVNERGVTVGPQGVVRADGGFVASTYDVSNSDFLNGGASAQRFSSAAGGSGDIIQQGVIESAFGDVFLIGTRVSNQGRISASRGTVGLAAAGDGAVVIRPAGNASGRMEIIAGPSSFGGNGIDNSGLIQAAAAELRAHGDAYRMAVNNVGAVEARGVSRTADGRVFLTATGSNGEAAGDVVNSGSVRALSQDGSGGTVAVTGKTVTLANGSVIDASAEKGDGGTVKIGGEFQGGKNLTPSQRAASLASATNIVVEKGALVHVDAAGVGKGGTAILWADKRTEFGGGISARGGEKGGDGGFVEVSGHKELLFDGVADVPAAVGKSGTVMLDPENFEINSTGGINAISSSALIELLKLGNYTIATNATGTGRGDITVSAQVSFTDSSTANLTLLAHGDIRLNASLRFSKNASGNITLVAGWDGTTFTLPASPGSAAAARNASWFGNAPSGHAAAGSIIIGSPSGTSGVSVGSGQGNTLLFGYDVLLSGGAASSAYAMVGTPKDPLMLSTMGDIGVFARNAVTLSGGSGSGASAAIGHSPALYATQAPITIVAGGALTLTGGEGTSSYAAIGHQTASAWTYDGIYANQSPITVSAQNIMLKGGNSQAGYAQIGHGGGMGRTGTAPKVTLIADDSAITVSSEQSLTMESGSALHAYTQIGHGGYSRGSSVKVQTNHSTITISVGNTLSIMNTSSSSLFRHSQIGHGGATGTSEANTLDGNAALVIRAGNLSITGAGAAGAGFVLVGHGLLQREANDETASLLLPSANAQSMLLDISAGNITFTNPGTRDNYHIAHSGSGAFSMLAGNIGTPLDLEYFTLQTTGNIAFASKGNMAMTSSTSRSFAGNLYLLANWDGTSGLTDGGATFNAWEAGMNAGGSGMLEVGGSGRIGTISGKDIILRGASVTVNNTLYSAAKIGVEALDTTTIGSSGRLIADAPGDAILLATNIFINNNLATTGEAIALQSANGRWLVSLSEAGARASRRGGMDASRVFNKTGQINTSGGSLQFTSSGAGSLPAGNAFLVDGNAPSLQLQAPALSFVYGNTIPVWTYALSNPNVLILGDDVEAALAGIAITRSVSPTGSVGSIPNAGSYILSATHDGNSDLGYLITLANGTLEVSKRPITITADTLYRPINTDNPTLTYTITGDLVGEDSVTGELSTDATKESPADTYEIQQGTMSLGSNYEVTFVPGQLVVTDTPSEPSPVPDPAPTPDPIPDPIPTPTPDPDPVPDGESQDSNTNPSDNSPSGNDWWNSGGSDTLPDPGIPPLSPKDNPSSEEAAPANTDASTKPDADNTSQTSGEGEAKEQQASESTTEPAATKTNEGQSTGTDPAAGDASSLSNGGDSGSLPNSFYETTFLAGAFSAAGIESIEEVQGFWDTFDSMVDSDDEDVAQAARHAIEVREAILALERMFRILDREISGLSETNAGVVRELRNDFMQESNSHAAMALRLLRQMSVRIRFLLDNPGLDGLAQASIASLSGGIDGVADKIWLSSVGISQIAKAIRESFRDGTAESLTHEKLQLTIAEGKDEREAWVAQNKLRRDGIRDEQTVKIYQTAVSVSLNRSMNSPISYAARSDYN